MTRQDPIRVMLADDENLIRGAIRSLLALEPDIDVLADAASGPEAVPMAGRHRPDVAVLDLIVTSHGRPGYLKRVLAAGESPLTPRESDVLELAARPRRRSRPRPPCPRARSALPVLGRRQAGHRQPARASPDSPTARLDLNGDRSLAQRIWPVPVTT